MRIAFFGTSNESVPTLKSLATIRNITGVFCAPDSPKGRGRQLKAPVIKQIAQELNIPCYQPTQWNILQSQQLWESLYIDLTIVVSYGFILPKWLLESCKFGVWNLHFSLLPKWRGASPVNHAILMGDSVTGVSLMRLTPGLDEGPIAKQCSRSITMHDNAQSLLTLLASDASMLLTDNLLDIEQKKIKTFEQNHTQATWAPKLNKNMSVINIKDKAIDIHRAVRALQVWPGTILMLDKHNIIKICGVGNIRSDSNPPGTLVWDHINVWLTAGDGNALEITTMQRPGKPIQPAAQALQILGPKNILKIDNA